MCHFWKFWDLKHEFLLNNQLYWPKKKLEHYLAHSCHFGHFSPGVRPFPPKAPIFQNSDIFANMAILGGLYVDEGDRQGKNYFFCGTPSMSCLFKKKGAVIKSLPGKPPKFWQKLARGVYFEITTLKLTIKCLIFTADCREWNPWASS